MACGDCRRHRQPIDAAVATKIPSGLTKLIVKLREASPFGEDRGGVMFCLMKANTRELIIPPTEIGTITNGKREKYTIF